MAHKTIIKAYNDATTGGSIGLPEKVITYAIRSGTTTLANQATIVWNSTQIDTHSAMNTSTGVWTAPRDGKYFFHIKTQPNWAVSSGRFRGFELRVNSVFKTFWFRETDGPTSNNIFGMIDGGIVLDLSENDTVDTRYRTDSGGSDSIDANDSERWSISIMEVSR